MLHANMRNKDGYLVSGTGLAQCARHALVRKNGVGDLQKGERQVVSSLLAFVPLIYVSMQIL